MRRIVLIVALVVAATGVTTSMANAHTCGQAVDVPLDKPSVITFGVVAEERAVTEIDAAVPRGFEVASVRPQDGWTASTEGATIRVTGGSLPPYTCGYFQVTGTARREAVLVFPLTVTRDDGSKRIYDSRNIYSPNAAQLVYAGDNPEHKAAPSSSSSSSSRALVALAIVLTPVIVVAFLARRRLMGAWRDRRRRRARHRRRLA